MTIYVDNEYKIISVSAVPSTYYEAYEETRTQKEMFGNLCDAVIQGYKYEPQYELEFNEDGSNARDETTGGVLYKLDDSGEKILQGYACYPFVDYQTLMLLQKQYEDSQTQIQALNAQIEYLSMMSGIETEVADE